MASAPVVAMLLRNEQQIDQLYGSRVLQQASRVVQYMKDAPAVAVFPTILGTVSKYAAGGGLIGMGVGAAAGGPAGLVVGGAIGLGSGAAVGFMVAYREQETQYENWLTDKRNRGVNDEVIAILRRLVEEKSDRGDPRFEHLLDPVHQTIMEQPVIDPVSGQVFDYRLNKEWIEKHRTNPMNHHQAMQLGDLRIDYETHGRLKVAYGQMLADQIDGVALTPNQRVCVQMLLADLETSAELYYERNQESANADLKAGRITRRQHAERMMRMADMLDPLPPSPRGKST